MEKKPKIMNSELFAGSLVAIGLIVLIIVFLVML